MATYVSRLSVNTTFYQECDYYDVCVINGSKFALFGKPFYDFKQIFWNLTDCSVVLLSPLRSEKNVIIKAISVIVLNTITSKGKVSLLPSEKLIAPTGAIKGNLDLAIDEQDEVKALSIRKARKEMIVREFKEGISNKHGPTILDAVMDLFDAIVDPSGVNEEIDIDKGLEFFKISSAPIERPSSHGSFIRIIANIPRNIMLLKSNGRDPEIELKSFQTISPESVSPGHAAHSSTGTEWSD